MSNFNFDLEAAADEDFFGTLQSKSSKLDQLFGEDVPQDEKQQSLKYKRPKATDLIPPAKNETSSPATTSQTSHHTLMAKVVTAYRQGELQGKVGLALIKNAEDTLILYKSKSHILVTLRLDPDQQVLFKQKNYWQFYDDLQHYWSFSFESQEDDDDFRDKLTTGGHRFKESEGQTIKKEEENKPGDLPKLNLIQNNTEEKSDMDLPQLTTKDVSKETKNALIKRMAKMGHPLPQLSTNSLQTTTDFSDSSDTEVINTPLPQKPTIAPRTNKLATLKNNQQLVTSSMAFNSAMYPANVMESQYMQMLLTEQRTQGSELRMNVTKLENKIEKVLDKLDLIDRAGTVETKEKRHKDDEILELEEKILNLKKENRKLKQLSEQRIEQVSYDQKSKEILDEFDDELKDLNMGHMKDLRTILKSCIDNIQEKKQNEKELQDKWQESEKNVKDKQTILEDMKTSNNRLEKQLKDLEDQQKEIQINVKEKQKLISDYELQIKNLKEELQEKPVEKPQNSSDSTVKAIMNNLFADICDKLETSHLDNADKVLALLATSIKEQTLKSLQQKQPGREE